MHKIILLGTKIFFLSSTAAMFLHGPQIQAQTFSGNDITNGPFSSGTQTFSDFSRFNANASGAAIGGTQSFQDNALLNASVQSAVRGGEQHFRGSSALYATAARALAGGTQFFFQDSTLHALADQALSTGSQRFWDTSRLNAQTENAISGGTQEFNGSSTLDASIARAVNGGLQRFNANSRLNAQAAEAVSEGLQIFSAESTLNASTGYAVNGGRQSFTDDSVLNAQVSHAVSGGGQTFGDRSVLNALATSAVSGGSLAFSDNSTLNASAVKAVSGLQLLFSNSSTLNASAADILASGTHFFRDSSVVNALAANAVSGGVQRFTVSSVLNAAAPQAVSGGSQYLAGDSVLNVSAAQGLSGGTQMLSNGSTLNVLTDDALTTGVAVAFEKLTGGLGGTLKLNGYSTTIGSIRTLMQGSGVIANGSATANSTLTIDGSAYAPRTYSGLIHDGGAGTLGMTLAGGTLTLSGTAMHTGGTLVRGGTLLVGNDAGAGTLSGATHVAAGGTLGGSGLLTGPTTVDGTLLASGPGILRFDDKLTLNSSAKSVFEFSSAGVVGRSGLGGNDLIRVAGELTLGGALDAQVPSAGYYRLFDYGTLSAGSAFSSSQVVSSRSGFDVANYRVLSTAAPKQVNLLVLGVGQKMQYWDGTTTVNGGSATGGDGDWGSFSTNWASDPDDIHEGWQSSVGIFGGNPGTVKVVLTKLFDTLQFMTDGYVIQGDALHMVPGGGVISVDGGVSATVESNIVAGAGNRLLKAGEGRLILSGVNSYTGGTRLLSGTVSVSQDDALGALAGELSFNGGLLQVTGTNYTSTNRAIALDERGGGFDIADAGNTFTLNQDIGGTGALYKVGAGTLALHGTNSYGNTRVVEGTLVGNAASLSGEIANAGTVVFQQDSDGSFAGDVRQFGDTDYDVGAMVKQGTGTLTLTGLSSLDWRIAQGTLASEAARFVGNAHLDGAASTFSLTDGTNASYGGTLSGTGLFSMDGNATVLLTGDSAGFAGRTRVNNGTLLVGDVAGEGALGGSIQVLQGATLGGSGTVGSGAGSNVTIAPGATLSPGSSIGTLRIDGDVVFEAGSRFVIEVGPQNGQSDLAQVTGTATLKGGNVAHVGANGQYKLNSIYTILSSQGGLTGRFDTVSSDFAFLQPELLYDDGAGTVKLSLARNNTDFRSTALTRNQLAAASGIESIGMGSGHAVYDAIAQLPNDLDLIRASFDAVSGEIHGSARTALIEESRFLRQATNDRLRAAFGAGAASSMNSVPLADEGVAGAGRPATAASAVRARPMFWSQGFGSWGSTSSDGNAARLSRDTGGLLMGADAPAGDWRVGVVAGYSHSSFKANDRASSGRSDNYHLGVYGGRQWGEAALRAGAAYSWHDMRTRRTVAIPGLSDSLRGDYKAGTFQAFAELGYGLHAGGARLEPFASLAHARLHVNGFTEQGGAAALSGASGTSAVTFGTLGLRAEYDFVIGADHQATLRGLAGWRHAWGDVTPESTHRFSAGQAFTIAGVPIARNSAVLEAGLDVRLTALSKLGVSWQGQLASGARDHSVRANLGIRF